MHDFEGNFIDANPAALKLMGYTKEEVLSLNYASLIGKDQSQKALNALAELKEKGYQENMTEFCIRDKEGKDIYVETKAAVIEHLGKPFAIQGIARDITERKRIEKALNEERRRFKVLAEESPFGISIISKEGHKSYLNQKFIEMFGYTLEDIPTGREWFLKAYQDEEYRRKVISTWTQDLKDSESGLSRPRTVGGPYCLDSLMGEISYESIGFLRHQAASANG